ncbi:2-keto-4-pentenoate hydratase [Jeotgalibacillus soli]|uniref:4-oxalocrotonate decarboxylase n=1 Tax=Jeotgalibacillus soli TaxID=889306 RepID=A0A0C2V844_9BACL|nr:fumarylacetoacetate hydrolase family protein [Jeotgalibacillus soli]KIL45127.1 4-oxalocrotonate decarboxylase [Jeotgalibacillus soli]
MSSQKFKEIAKLLLDAEIEKKEVLRITADKIPELTVDEAYLIQKELINLKIQQGLSVVGPKMGLTSRAKMKQMNVEEPIYGYIFDNMVVQEGSSLSLSELIHPKVEAEIAFVLDKDLAGPAISGVQVLAATKYVLPALEIIDSRYENFQFTLPDVIADNTSSARVVFGNQLRRPEELELDLVGTTLSINGEIRALGAGGAVLGHPAHSVAMLANMLHREGSKLKAGQIILTGGITEAILLENGDEVVAKFDQLGQVSIKITD